MIGSARPLVLAMLVVSSDRALAEPCAARAELDGDRTTVTEIASELTRLGVETGKPTPGCRGVYAVVERDAGGGIQVAIRDGSKRSEGRVVGDPAIAASWIDSWLHDDLDGTTWLVAVPAPNRVAELGPAGGPPATVAPRIDQPPAHTSWIDRMSLTASYDYAWLADDSTASGFSVAGSLRIGRGAFGLHAGYLEEPERTIDLTAMARGDSWLLATASLPISAGRMSIAPELGVGIGRTTTRRIEGCDPMMPPPNCDPSDPTCAMQPVMCSETDPGTGKTFVGDHLDEATVTPRLAASIRIAVPLFEHVWLDGLVGIQLAPFGHSDPFGSTSGLNADGTMDPNTGMVDQLALPGEPGHGWRIAIGLRVGAP